MDPLSITASTAGLISLSFQLFAGCIQGFVLLSTAHNLGKDASTIICMLNLQEIHLTEWARAAGLLQKEGKLDVRLNARVVEETLQCLQDLLTDTSKLKKRYNLDLIPAPQSNTNIAQTSNQATQISGMGKVFAGISDETRRDVLLRAGLIQSKTSFPKRLWWAAVDKDNIEQLVEKTHRFIRELWFLLDPWRQDDLMKTTQGIASNMIALVDRFDQLKSLNDALQRLDKMQIHDGEKSSFKGLAVSADIKAVRVGLEKDDENVPPMSEKVDTAPSRQVLLQGLERLARNLLSDFQGMRKRTDMGIAQYNGEAVFVEWKELNTHLKKKILPRIDNLAALLNLPKDDSFRSLHCRGTIEKDDKVAFIYSHPSPSTPSNLPKSLYDLFSAKDGIEPPSLTARIALALCIARSIQSFHRAGWLHKNLRSENIVFFADSKRTKPYFDTTSPILAGFTFSRFAAPTEISEQPSASPQHDIYRHPSAMGDPSVSFDAFMDLYSLGTILVEIAEWRALKFIVQSTVNVDEDNVPLSKIAEVRPFLLSGKGKGGTSKLRTKMGDIYNMACMLCLAGNEGGNMSAAGLLDEVIKKLEGCKV